MARDHHDSGWAWMIVVAVTIINLSILPVQQCFGLIFAERFSSLGISTTQTSLILHLNGTITCCLGLISGPMMKRFSFRKVAFFGGLTVAAGVCTTSFAVSVPWIIVTYCLITGIGHGIMFPATSLALNTYFRKKRNVAMGFTVTLTGLGPILMPLLIVKLLEFYGTTGALIILAGIATNSCIGASLLKPFKESQISNLNDQSKSINTEPQSKDEVDLEVGEIRENNSQRQDDGKRDKVEVGNETVESRLLDKETEKKDGEYVDNVLSANEESKKRTVLRKIVKNLDLELLKDNRYVAVVLGMGLSMVAETNFNALFPFVLAELSGLEMTTVATVMAIQAAFDITGRLFVPLLAQKCGWTSRNLYVISLFGSTLGRTILSTWGSTYMMVLVVAMIAGLSKGTKAVFQALIIPDYVPLERLPAASGIQMVCNGILSIGLGPIIGLVRDSTKSYVGALHFTSALSMSCVFLWFIDGLWMADRLNSAKRKLPRKEEVNTES